MSEIEEKSEFEELSAWLDNEDNNLSEEQQNSPENKQVADDFRTIDAAISKVSAAPTAPAGLADKIAAKVQEDTSAAPKPIDFSRHLTRIAIVAAACIAISFFYKTDTTESTTVSEVSEKEVTPKAIPELSSASADKTEKFDKALRGNPKPATPSGEFNLIGTNPNDSESVEYVTLKEEIKHVWVCEDPAKTIDLLRQLTDKVNDMATQTDAKGNVELTIIVTDKELVNIVEGMSKAGNDLVSKDFPQPKQTGIVQLSGKSVQYKISIIRKN